MQADRFVPAAQNDRFDPAAGNMKSARFQVDINATDSDLIPSKTDSQETPTCQVQQTDSVTTYTTCAHMSVWFRFKEYNVNHQIPSTTPQQSSLSMSHLHLDLYLELTQHPQAKETAGTEIQVM